MSEKDILAILEYYIELIEQAYSFGCIINLYTTLSSDIELINEKSVFVAEFLYSILEEKNYNLVF